MNQTRKQHNDRYNLSRLSVPSHFWHYLVLFGVIWFKKLRVFHGRRSIPHPGGHEHQTLGFNASAKSATKYESSCRTALNEIGRTSCVLPCLLSSARQSPIISSIW